MKGIWCVPKYSNPEGIIYSKETIRPHGLHEARRAGLHASCGIMRTASTSLTATMWSSRTFLHQCKKYGNYDMVYEFASTSKITFPGDGVACMATSEANLEDFEKWIGIQTISYDKVNQQRHVLYLQNRAHTLKLMKKHAAFMKPKFEAVSEHSGP